MISGRLCRVLFKNDQRPLSLGNTLFPNDYLLGIVHGGKLEHQVEHGRLDHRAETAGADGAFLGDNSDSAQRLSCKRELDAVEIEQQGKLLHEGVLGPRENLHERVLVEFIDEEGAPVAVTDVVFFMKPLDRDETANAPGGGFSSADGLTAVRLRADTAGAYTLTVRSFDGRAEVVIERVVVREDTGVTVRAVLRAER